jgi:hypothetical protein
MFHFMSCLPLALTFGVANKFAAVAGFYEAIALDCVAA